MRVSFNIIRIVITKILITKVLITFAIVVFAAPAQAQPMERLLVSLNFAGVSVEGHSEFGTTVSVLYRFNRVVALGGEIVGHRWTPPDRPIEVNGSTQIEYRDPSGRSSTFALTMRVDAPQFWQLVPFALVGGGVAVVKERYNITTIDGGFREPGTPISSSEVGAQAMAGGGLSVMIVRNTSIDLDIRYLYSQKQPDSSAVRVGAGVSYRF